MRPIAVMNTALVLNAIGFANIGAVLPALRADTGFGEAEAGFAGGLFFLTYAIGSPVFAALTDTRDPRRLYLLGCLMGIAGGLAFPLVDDSYAALLVSRALTGFGFAGTYMPGLRLLMESLPAERQARGAALYVSSLTLGLSACFAVSGVLQLAFGWGAAFLGAAVGAGLALLLVLGGMASPAMVPSEAGLLPRLLSVARQRGVGFVLVMAAGNSWEGMAFRVWWVALLGAVVALPGNEGWGGVNFALATAFSGLIAMPASAWVARRAETGRRHRVIAMAAGSSVLVGVVLAGMLEAPFLLVFVVSVAWACTIFSDAGAIPSALLALVPRAERGAALALMAACANSAAFLAIVISGVVLEMAGGAHDLLAWRVTIGVIVAGSLVGALGMLVLDRRR